MKIQLNDNGKTHDFKIEAKVTWPCVYDDDVNRNESITRIRAVNANNPGTYIIMHIYKKLEKK